MEALANVGAGRLLDYGLLGVLLLLSLISIGVGGRWFIHRLEESHDALARSFTDQRLALTDALDQQRTERLATIQQCREEREEAARTIAEQRHDFTNTLAGFSMGQQMVANNLASLKDAIDRSQRQPQHG
jgi:hypothetical protein